MGNVGLGCGVMKRTLLVVAAVTAVVVLAAVLYRTGTETPAGTSVAPKAEIEPPKTAERAAAPGAKTTSDPAVGTPAPEEFRFTLLDPPGPLPDIRFMDAEKRWLTLADFRGKVILLNLWATWCIPCVREMPSLDRLQERLGSPGFQVVALSIDVSGLPEVERFYKKLELKSLAMYVDKSAASRLALKIKGMPTTLLIDRQGREIGRVTGAAEWDSAPATELIRRYLK